MQEVITQESESAVSQTQTPPSRPERKPGHPAKTIRVPKLDAILTKEEKKNPATLPSEQPATSTTEFSNEQLRIVWQEFAEKRKPYLAEFQLLNQTIILRGNQVVLHLHNAFQETLLQTFKADITAHLRKQLNNSEIVVSGELQSSADKKVLYTNREKFEHLAEKNPALYELRDRLGLDADF